MLQMAIFIVTVSGRPRVPFAFTVAVTTSRLRPRNPFVVGVVYVPQDVLIFRPQVTFPSFPSIPEWARDIVLALRGHLKAECGRDENNSVSTRLRGAHVELYHMLVRPPPTTVSLTSALVGT